MVWWRAMRSIDRVYEQCAHSLPRRMRDFVKDTLQAEPGADVLRLINRVSTEDVLCISDDQMHCAKIRLPSSGSLATRCVLRYK